MTTGTQEPKTTGNHEHNLTKGTDILLASQDGTVLAGHVAATRNGQVTVDVDGPATGQWMPHGGMRSIADPVALLMPMARPPLEVLCTAASAIFAGQLVLARLITSS